MMRSADCLMSASKVLISVSIDGLARLVDRCPEVWVFNRFFFD